MKMQIAFRETSTVRHGHSVVMAGGAIEVSPEEWVDYDEKALAFRFDFASRIGHPVAVTAVGGARPITDQYGWIADILEAGQLEDLLTSEIERAIPTEHVNADFVLRATEMPPSVEDGRVFAFSGFLHLRPGQQFDFENLLWFESFDQDYGNVLMYSGRSGIERRPELGSLDMTELMRGESWSALLRKPLWGFGEKPYGLPGTMRIDLYRKLERYHSLYFCGERSAAEQAEFEDVREVISRAGLHTIERNEEYREFCREMRALHPEFKAYMPMTTDQIVSREESAKVIIASILRRDETRFG